ncbi:fimbrial biogenesis chaperone [Pseudoxanthomonas wuyuanensis]|uniref:Fimbrial chaperone protein n=1 Tax=Pseudoxanthomonas wuyuanensis TaxID=1073196 RepID=A0A286DFX2_9GAMM|nr:molecular chaperone [Pseudoxanthomonas wuyuanensis]SOD57506.1 fimbrial chaperone protein [Pseudoxanthomonas wuyuanensis]
MRSGWCGILCLAWLASAVPALASGLQVSPTTLTLPAERNADGLWLSNTGNSVLRAQLRVYRWTQENAEEKLEPTRDLAISPPMLELPPGERQLVRLIRLGAPPQEAETSYRVIVDELPPAAAPNSSGLQFVLRYSIPVFLSSAGEAAPAPVLHATLDRSQPDVEVEISNSGGLRAQIADLAYVDAGGRRHLLAPGLLGYVLPGQRMRWPLARPSAQLPPGGTLKARINGEAEEQSLSLASAAR